MKGVEYSLDKTLHRIASNLQINNCCRHFSAVRTSCFLLKYQVFTDSERVELRYYCKFFEDVVLKMLRRLLPDFIPVKTEECGVVMTFWAFRKMPETDHINVWWGKG